MGVSKEMAKQMFRTVDADKGGTIDIREFLMYYGIIGGGTIEQKLELSFKLFDAGTTFTTNSHLIIRWKWNSQSR